MNSKDLLRALGDIDDKYIDEEYDTPKEKNKKEILEEIENHGKELYDSRRCCRRTFCFKVQGLQDCKTA